MRGGSGSRRCWVTIAPGATSSTGCGIPRTTPSRSGAASGIPGRAVRSIRVEVAGGYASASGFLRRLTLSYAFVSTDRRSDLIAKSAMDFLRHKAALTAEVRFLRRMSFALTATVADRNGS